MSSQLPRVIAYGYSASPMWRTISHALLLRRIPHSLVTVKNVPPRPQLLQLGITYRRIPVVFIGNEAFFDTNLIFLELERRFKPEDGFPSLLSSSPGLQQIASTFWVNRVLFPRFFTLVRPEIFTPELREDRQEMNPAPSFEALESIRPTSLGELRTHLSYITQQLEASSTPYLLGTHSPSLIDVTAYTIFAWARSWKHADSVLTLPSSKAPLETRRAMEWFEAIRGAIHAASGDASNLASKPDDLDGDGAFRTILSKHLDESEGNPTVFDASDPIVRAGSVTVGDLVSVAPTDSFKVPQFGRLVGLTTQSVSILIQVPDSECTIRGHFPRLGYSIERVKGGKDVYARL